LGVGAQEWKHELHTVSDTSRVIEVQLRNLGAGSELSIVSQCRLAANHWILQHATTPTTNQATW
jgi:hypothetical protein